MAQQKPPDLPLDVLPAMVNAVLVQTAKVFRDPSKHTKNIVHTNTQIKEVIPAALDRYHSALDELEIEILRAKATLQRDLKVSRQRRIETEQRAVDDQGVSKDVGSHQPSEVSLSDKPALISHDETPSIDKDVEMGNSGPATAQAANIPSQDVQQSTEPSIPMSDTDAKAITSAKQSPQPEVSKSTDSEPVSHTLKSKSMEEPAAENSNNNFSQEPMTESTPATAGASNLDFDSMFPENSMDDGTMDLNFDLDFSVDTSGNDSAFIGDNGGIAVATGDGLGDTAAPLGTADDVTSNDDMNILLPGLENYADASDDMNLLAASGDGDLTQVNTDSQQTYDASGMADLLPPESTNFDDLFLSGDLDLGDSNVDGEAGGSASGTGGDLNDLFLDLGQN
ncbi:MAG: hypothetical protein M1825_003462 [Sarcosagium campestre]|nr:MAG: hypothetical protein M1825_003462 [Sarcosagium campestre]